ncbi:MAG: F0F1 ATP synthase subunit delta [Gemmatimonadetes bacterium]|nr:F0F1 ATP synthase subunit delta [Gemmatimonadota bacterium]MBI3567672.1 F0F1 ATP synthase subunit delta [Gemmatimonadota bacterium]
MRDESIARNYADVLLTLARQANATDEWAGIIHAIAGAVEQDRTLQLFLAAPQVSEEAKIAMLGRGLEGKVPKPFIRFLQKLVMNRRQTLIPEIATAYGDLLDAAEGRVHARVTVSRETTDADVQAMTASLSKALGKSVVPHVTVNPKILGGVVVRVGDTVMDGSVKRRLEKLRGQMAGR